MKKYLLFIVIILLSGCANTQFEQYDGENSIIQGHGGTKSVIDGMEIWSSGTPPHKYKLLGFINDSRPGGGIPMSQLDADMVRKAREVGGDAIIRLTSNSEITGYVGNSFANATAYGNRASAYGSSFAAPVRRNYANFAVIKYLD